MEFRDFMINEYARKLARAYADTLKDVPQNPDHHPEGSVLNHVRLVRKSISSAAQELNALKSDPLVGEALVNLDFGLGSEDTKILNVAAWLHDIGKFTSTTVDGVHFSATDRRDGKIQAIGHETPAHYRPQIERLSELAPKEMVEFYKTHSDLINFLIERHMDFAHGGFPNRVIAEFFENGRVKDDRRMKLLLVLMWADKMGRGKAPDLEGNVKKLKEAADKSRRNHARLSNQSRPFAGGEEEFRSMLAARGLSPEAVEAAVRAKFAKVQG